jgi:excisionase family DNA binding protein
MQRRATPATVSSTVKDVAERYGVSVQTVLGWIRSGELAAINVGRRANAKKPRWRISEAALEAFEAKRTPVTVPLRRRSQKPRTDIIKFY